MFTINLDRESRPWGLSDKIWNLTLAVFKKVFENAGIDGGEWILTNVRRVRKKGQERFKALRIESSGKTKTIRIRCKPQGNDTSFEYSLVPPHGFDIANLFHLLDRVHSKTLAIHDTMILKTVIEHPVIREYGPLLTPLIRPIQAQSEPIQAQSEPIQAQSEPIQVDTNLVSKTLSVSPNSIEKLSSLALKEFYLLSDQEVMDRALVAIAFVSVRGYAKRTEVSSSVIENLNLTKFINEISEGKYISIEGAMRSIIMALRKNNYIERVHYSTGGDGVKGYKFTCKGERRVVALKKFLEDNILNRFNRSWCKFTTEENFDQQNFEFQNEIEDEPENQIEVEQNSEEESENYSELEDLISSLKDANDQIVEASGFIGNLDSEKDDLSIELIGLDKAIEEQIKQKEEIEKRIKKLKDKKEELNKAIENKEKEIEDWQEYQKPYLEEKEKIKKQIGRAAKALGIEVKS